MERVSPSLLAIAGSSCSGKDTLIQAMRRMSPTPFSVLSFDDYFVGMDRLKGQEVTDWENPNLYRYDDYVADLQTLKRGGAIKVECHSRESTLLGIRTRIVTPTRWVVVYGWLVLHSDEANQRFDRKVFLDISEEEWLGGGWLGLLDPMVGMIRSILGLS